MLIWVVCVRLQDQIFGGCSTFSSEFLGCPYLLPEDKSAWWMSASSFPSTTPRSTSEMSEESRPSEGCGCGFHPDR